MDQAGAPCPAALGFPTHLLTGLPGTAPLNGICFIKSKVSLSAPSQPARVLALKEPFFPVWRRSAPFPRVFLLGDSVRLSDWWSSAVRDGASCILPWQAGDAPTGTAGCCGPSLLGLGSLERRKTLTSDWRRILIRLSSEKEEPETKLHKLLKNCFSDLCTSPRWSSSQRNRASGTAKQ